MIKAYITKLRLGAQETGKTPTKPFSGAGNRTVSEIITDYVNGNFDVLRELDDAYAQMAEQIIQTAGIPFRPAATREPLNYNYIYSIEDVDLPF